MRKTICVALVCLAATALFAGVSGATLEYSGEYSDTAGGGSASWTESMTFPKFDPGLGSFVGIKFTLIGDVSGSAQFENLSGNPATVVMNQSATLKLSRPAPAGTVIVQSIPLASSSDAVDSYDQVTDYSGPGGSQTTGSGRTHADLSASHTEYFTSYDAADLVLFTAAFSGENIDLPATSTAGSGGYSLDTGDLALLFGTNAGATAKVQYIYETVPEPSSILALLTGFIGLVGVAVRRRK